MDTWIATTIGLIAMHSPTFQKHSELYAKGTPQRNLQDALRNWDEGDFQIKLVYDQDWISICIKDMSNIFRRFDTFPILKVHRKVLKIMYQARFEIDSSDSESYKNFADDSF